MTGLLREKKKKKDVAIVVVQNAADQTYGREVGFGGISFCGSGFTSRDWPPPFLAGLTFCAVLT